MNILITTPSLTVPHGGTRVLNEWATRLGKWHNVKLLVQHGSLECDWYDVSSIERTKDLKEVAKADCVIIGSPHAVALQGLAKKKCFIFLQMMEHMFNPKNSIFIRQCNRLYQSKNPLISISQWNIEQLKRKFGRKYPTFYVGNGVNFDHFPVERPKKENVILVEGWEAGNNTKDSDAIGPRVAARLKKRGMKVWAYSQKPLSRYPDVPDEYFQNPSLPVLNELYAKAKILLKATKYDARSTAPMEAMTKGTPTVRAITRGDDDLTNEFNCLKVPYDEQALYQAAVRTLSNDRLYENLSLGCLEHVQKYTWDYWMEEINNIICTKG